MIFRTCHRPIIPLLFAFSLGILAGRFAPVLPGAWLVVAAATLRLLWLLYHKKPARISPLLLFAALGYIAVSPYIFPVFPPGPVRPFLDEKPRRLSGIIVEPPEKNPFRTRCVLKDIEIPGEEKSQSVSLPGRVQLHVYGAVPEMHPGDRVTLEGGIRQLKNFNNPGGFDYRQYMAFERIWGSAYGSSRTIEVRPAVSKSFFRKIAGFRESVHLAIGSVSGGDSRTVLSALVIGKTERISPPLQDAFSRSGASHLLSISGLHVAIVASCAMVLFKWLFGRSAFILRRAWLNKGAAMAAFIPVIGYALISGMAPATQRAVIMVAFFLAACVWEREYDSANTLAAAALAILLISPPALFNISFQLSFAAVAAILFGFHLFPGINPPAEGIWEMMRKILIGFTAISLFAIIGTTPLVMHYFNQVCLIGIVSNLVLIPLLGFLAVILGLLSTFILLFSESLALFGFTLADIIVRAGLYFIHLAAAVPLGSFKTVTPSLIELTCIYLLLICIPIWMRNRLSNSELPRKVFSFQRGIAAVILIATIIMAGDAGYWIHRRLFHPDLRVTILDVGQGNASLIEIPGSRTVLIDGGGFTSNTTFDVGKLIVGPYLWDNKIRTIDTVILTHPDADHLNGLLFILENFRIRRVISTHITAESEQYQRFTEIIARKRIPHPDFKSVDSREVMNGVVFDILYPPVIRKTVFGSGKSNNGSIVMKVTYNGVSLLFPGDIEASAETELLSAAARRLDADILLSPHHGSRTSSTTAFLDAVDPDTVIISARKSRFGPPSKEVIERYQRRGYHLLQTEREGAIRIIVDGNKASIKSGNQETQL